MSGDEAGRGTTPVACIHCGREQTHWVCAECFATLHPDDNCECLPGRVASPHYEDNLVTVHHGDCMAVMRDLPDSSVDSIVTDPPYGLGFMGKAWDDLPPGLPWAQECQRVLRPGGHLLAFGGTRTWHRLACAVEDAGFEVRDSIAWLYGSGFPKSLNLAGGLGTALKPAHEPVVVARKPLVGTVAANVLAHGTGALNIDACRVEGIDPANARRLGKSYGDPDSTNFGDVPMGQVKAAVVGGNLAGRWPANVVLDTAAAAELDRQSGVTTSKAAQRGDGIGSGYHGSDKPHDTVRGFDDSGGASRFFYVAKAPARERPKADDGTAHPTVKPLTLMRWLVRLVTPPGGVVLEPFAGSGTTVEACLLDGFRCIAIEREADYLPLIDQRIRRVMDAPPEPPRAATLFDQDGAA